MDGVDHLWFMQKFAELQKQLDRIKQARAIPNPYDTAEQDIKRLESEVAGMQLYLQALLHILVAKKIASWDEIDQLVQTMLQRRENTTEASEATPEDAAAQAVYKELGLAANDGP
jgi:hypothetical protein